MEIYFCQGFFSEYFKIIYSLPCDYITSHIVRRACYTYNKWFGITKPLTILFICYLHSCDPIVHTCTCMCALSSFYQIREYIKKNSYESYFIWFREKKFEIWSPLINSIFFQVECFHVKSASSRIAVHLTAHPLVVRALGRKRSNSFCLFSFGITFTHFFKAHTHTNVAPPRQHDLCPEGHFLKKAFLGNFRWKNLAFVGSQTTFPTHWRQK